MLSDLVLRAKEDGLINGTDKISPEKKLFYKLLANPQPLSEDSIAIHCEESFSSYCSTRCLYVTQFWKISLNVTLKYVKLHNLL